MAAKTRGPNFDNAREGLAHAKAWVDSSNLPASQMKKHFGTRSPGSFENTVETPFEQRRASKTSGQTYYVALKRISLA
jgi:hypothetical protein